MKRDATMRISENQSYASLLLAQKAREPTLSSYAGMSPTSFNLPINLSIPVAYGRVTTKICDRTGLWLPKLRYVPFVKGSRRT